MIFSAGQTTWDYTTDPSEALYLNGQSSQVGTALRWDPVALQPYIINPGASSTEFVSHFGMGDVNPQPADLTIVASKIILDPIGPVDAGDDVDITAYIYNIGGTASTAFDVEIWVGEPGAGTLIRDARTP